MVFTIIIIIIIIIIVVVKIGAQRTNQDREFVIDTIKYNFIFVSLVVWAIERSNECRKTKTKLIIYQLDYSANLKP